jgi:serine/threonine protein kinase
LDHPNIVKVNDLRVSEDGQEITLIEPLLKGETLDKTILRLGKTPAGFRIKMEIMRQVADALDYCHTQGVVYADLKMGSILVELNEDKPGDFKLENVTLIDFGQSIEINKPHPLDGSHFDIRYGAIEQYLAQEQGNRDLIRNPLVDYQSFGTLLYEVFTGSHPSKYRSYQPTLMQRPNSYDLTKAPKEARDLMRHILSCNPEERKQVGTLKKFVDQVDIAYEDHRRTGLLAHVRQQLSILNRTKT